MTMDHFLRIALPLILVAIFIIIGVFVFNALQATERMELEQRAGPTLLNQ